MWGEAALPFNQCVDEACVACDPSDNAGCQGDAVCLADGKRLAGYAASSKGTVILNYCDIGPDVLEYVCDNTPSKHGLFTPGTHIPIVPIEKFSTDYPDYAFVLAWNHLKEIAAKEKAYRNQGGKFIIHIPTAQII